MYILYVMIYYDIIVIYIMLYILHILFIIYTYDTER